MCLARAEQTAAAAETCAQATRPGGFTLVEVLIALVIFSIIGLAATQMLQQVVFSEAQSSERSKRLGEVQRAMTILERDLAQVIDRPIRDGLGDSVPAVQGGFEPLLEFTRTGWRNALDLPRSELQRVAYQLEDEVLVRYYWQVLDRAEDSEPLRQELLRQVTSFEVEFLRIDGESSSFWPADVDDVIVGAASATQVDSADFGEEDDAPGSGPNEPARNAQLPAAVRVFLSVDPYGAITRLVPLPEGGAGLGNQLGGDGGQGGDGNDGDERGDDTGAGDNAQGNPDAREDT